MDQSLLIPEPSSSLPSSLLSSESHIAEVINHLKLAAHSYDTGLELCLHVLKNARDEGKEIFVFGSGFNAELAGHTNVDWIKFARLKTIEIGIPTLTAYGNDYPINTQLKEFLKHRGFGKKNVLIGIQIGSQVDELLQDAFDYSAKNGGINILITNNLHQFSQNEHCYIYINEEDDWIAADISQTFSHYIGTKLAGVYEKEYSKDWNSSYLNYSSLLIHTLGHNAFSDAKMGGAAEMILNAINNGKNIYAFGNGGSAAMSAYLTESLQNIFNHSHATLRNIFNLSSYHHIINDSIKNNSFKNDVFTSLLNQHNPATGDIFIGISTSGNSENIINPFRYFPDIKKIGILGFGDGGYLGKSDFADLTIIIPDDLKHKSYAIAEDGQRIALTSILKNLQGRIAYEDGIKVS